MSENHSIDPTRRESDARFRAIFDNAPVGMLVLSSDGRFLQVNPAFCRFLGYSEQELLQKAIEDFTPPEDRSATADAVRAVLADEAVLSPFEKRYLRANGDVVWGEVNVSVFHGLASEFGHIAMVIDITARKQAEDALRESENRLQTVLDSVQVGVVMIDVETHAIVDVNPYAAALIGAPRETIIGYVCHSYICPAEEGKCPITNLAQTVDKSERVLIRADGAQVPILKTVVSVRRGERTYLIESFLDITERKRAEKELAQRSEAIEILHDAASIANQSQDPKQAIEQSLRRLAMYNGWSFGHALMPSADDPDRLTLAYVCYQEDHERFSRFREVTRGLRLRRNDGMPGRVFASGKPEWITDIRRDLHASRAAVAEELGIRTAVAFPVLVREKVAAVLEFFSEKLLPPDERILDVMAGVGMQLGRVIERADFEEHLLSIAEEVQREIAQDLHDDVGQELTGLSLKTETLAEILAEDRLPVAELAEDIAMAVERTRSKVRGLSRLLLPVELEEGLLANTLAQLAGAATKGTGVICCLDCSQPDIVFDSRVARHLYRIAQEALANAVRHGEARRVTISLVCGPRETALAIADDGKGLTNDEIAKTGGMGLRTMRYRASLIGASLEVGAGPLGGVQVVCRLPEWAGRIK